MIADKDWEDFKKKLFAKSKINLHDYKPAQMQRRIGNMMARHKALSYVQFFDLINKDDKLYKEFIDFLTINVTEFFRTPEKFVELQTTVLPELLKKNARLSIWSAGCSTGAEPYSLAMILDELTPHTKHRIIATDLDSEMLTKAAKGQFVSNELKNVSPSRLAKYFKPCEGGALVNDDIKKRVEFKRHNLLLDSFESNLDIIFCRNVVIYFTEEAKEALYRRFFGALRSGGVLFVGGTEAILNFRDIGFHHYLPFFYRKP
jgi:chemotaxis protein methyltransferase CheR